MYNKNNIDHDVVLMISDTTFASYEYYPQYVLRRYFNMIYNNQDCVQFYYNF